jgi:hypothetical protein
MMKIVVVIIIIIIITTEGYIFDAYILALF